jgi:hypothetical protein
MTRIAEAQRRRGHHVGEDAERAWTDACSAAEGLLSSPQPQEGELPTSNAPILAPLPALVRGDRVSFRTELGTLIERIFNVPPFGAGLKCAMFCSVEPNGAAALTTAVGGALATATSCSRIIVVSIAHGVAPRLELADSGIRVLSMNPAEAYHRLPELKARFDRVLLHAQVTANDPEMVSVARAADGVVLVVNENTTRRRVAKQIVELLVNGHARVLGSVLADRSYPIPLRIYERF